MLKSSHALYRAHELTAVNPAKEIAHCFSCGSIRVKLYGNSYRCPNLIKQLRAHRKPIAPQKAEQHETRSVMQRCKKYGVSIDQIQEAHAAAGGGCAICRDPLHRFGHIDHDHSTGQFRGLLCSRCNTGLGCFRDDPDMMRAAARYIERARAAYVTAPKEGPISSHKFGQDPEQLIRVQS